MQKGISLHIGLNRIDPGHYSDVFPILKGPEFDAEDMRAIAEKMGFDNEKILNAGATREAVLNRISQAANTLEAGDIFLITFSGHGSNLPGKEKDGKDETWCLYNGQVPDNELFDRYCEFREDVRILVISDSCHSGTVIELHGNRVIKSLPDETQKYTFLSNKAFYDNIRNAVRERSEQDLKASIKLLAACQDNQVTEDDDFNSVYTRELKKVWQQGSFQGNYQQFHNALLARFDNTPQIPNYLMLGKSNTKYDNQRPFTV
ncbi:caspase family protein [Chitinophaga niabensis]|uniref:Caspase domain-containing protein n=1 Tax=Chitinophaga niabensis TaxID=536979 RepID=A0A1N6D695_9BACT|nr:caspase family protein [Chitinophaga niabensis]SIN66253.1 Caspase domain-containing protein [Chitinophaga niabensis]